jgi:phage tail-like protein
MAGGRIPPGPNDALTAARFSITIEGVEIAQFSELVEITSGVDPSSLTLVSAPKRGAGARKLPGKRTPPTVTLKRGQTSDLSLFAWHLDSLSRRAARKDAVLVMYDVQGGPVARYHLENAWPAKIVVDGDKVGATQVLFETVLLVSDGIERVAP